MPRVQAMLGAGLTLAGLEGGGTEELAQKRLAQTGDRKIDPEAHHRTGGLDRGEALLGCFHKCRAAGGAEPGQPGVGS